MNQERFDWSMFWVIWGIFVFTIIGFIITKGILSLIIPEVTENMCECVNQSIKVIVLK